MTTFSLVMPCAHGVLRCLPLDQLLADGIPDNVEIILVDGSKVGQSKIAHPRVRYFHAPGVPIWELSRVGASLTQSDWIIFTKDHCKLMPGYFAAYAEAIRAHPGADIFSGSVSSETSASGISWANFYYGYYELWPPLKFVPGFVSMANFAVRRGILVGADLDRDGALEFLALPRLAARITHCPDAVVDHVENWRWFDYLRGHFHNGRASIAVVHALRPESIAGRGLRVVRHCVNVVCLRPLRVVGGLRRVIARRWLLFPALVLLGLSHAIGILVGSMLGAGNSKFDIHGLSND